MSLSSLLACACGAPVDDHARRGTLVLDATASTSASDDGAEALTDVDGIDFRPQWKACADDAFD